MHQLIDNYMIRDLHDDPHFNRVEDEHMNREEIVALAKKLTPFAKRQIQMGMSIAETEDMRSDDVATLADILLEMEII